jgi:hypothetical protein
VPVSQGFAILTVPLQDASARIQLLFSSFFEACLQQMQGEERVPSPKMLA